MTISRKWIQQTVLYSLRQEMGRVSNRQFTIMGWGNFGFFSHPNGPTGFFPRRYIVRIYLDTMFIVTNREVIPDAEGTAQFRRGQQSAGGRGQQGG